MLSSVEIEVTDLKNPQEVLNVRDFLARFNLTYEDDLEYTIVLRLDGTLVGTGSLKDEVLRNIAIDENYQGQGLTSIILTELMKEQTRRGRLHYFIFTKSDKEHLFMGLGFKRITKVEPYVSLLESGIGSISSYCEKVNEEIRHLRSNRAALVLNCNPFTNGHQALIRKAAKENEAVIVFIVSEDRSLFPFEDRIKLVRNGVRDLENVVVLPSGKYIISNATFPTYFVRDEDKVIAQTRLDITLFAEQIAPRLGITSRYVGEEPYCPVTCAYNQAMQDIFPKHNIELKVMKRIEVEGEIVSASKVREAICRDDWASIRKFVPDVTFNYLRQSDTQGILQKIKQTHSRH